MGSRRSAAALILAVTLGGYLIGGGAHLSMALLADSESDPSTFTTAASFGGGGTPYYLHNNPTPPVGDTASQANLPLNTTAPTAATLQNYDTDRDALAGLIVLKGASGVGETDTTKYQNWRTAALASPITISGTATVDFWSAIKDFGLAQAGEVTAYLRDFNPSGSTYTEIANATLNVADWQGGSGSWVNKTLNISVGGYTLATGRQLELKLIVGAGAADNMWFAYDTTAYPSKLTVPIVADTTPPAVANSVISKTTPYIPGYIRQGGTYYVYANVTDAGSGVATVTANVSTVTTGQTAVALVAGSYTIGGVGYNYRSASVTANATLSVGAKAYTITATDVATNSVTQTGFSVTVDNTRPTGTNVQTTNAGTAGQPALGDTIIFTFSEPIDAQSVLAGWTGTATNVVLRITQNAGGDQVTVRNAANSAALPFGTVNLVGTNYVTATRDFGATGTASSMVQSGNAITVTLGTASGAVGTQATANNMVWTPSATATDRAGNTCQTTNATEATPLDIDF